MVYRAQSSGVAALQVEDHPSSVIGKVGEHTVEGSADEEDHSGGPMHPERRLDLSKSCAELEQDQDHVDKRQHENDRTSAGLHTRSSHGGNHLTTILSFAGPLLP